jgi:hypothetical protein
MYVCIYIYIYIYIYIGDCNRLSRQGGVHTLCMEAVDAAWAPPRAAGAGPYGAAAGGNATNQTGWRAVSSGQHCLHIVNDPVPARVYTYMYTVGVH